MSAISSVSHSNQYAVSASTANESEGKLVQVKKPSGRNLSIKKIVTMALAVQGATMVPQAKAGPIAYTACVTICCGTFPPLIPVLLPSCAAGCAPVLLLPTP